MIKAVLFDFDGTLLNTNDLIFTSYEYAFTKVLGRSITDEEIHDLYGKPLYSSLAKYGEHQDALCDTYREFNESHHDELVKKFDGAAEGVRMIKNSGIKTAVVTSKRRYTLEKGIRILGLEDFFDVLITPDNTEKHKPDPEPVLKACELLGVSPSEAIMVGDSVFDFECAKRAGARLAGVNYSTTRDAIMEYKPDYMVDTLVELAEKLI